MSTSSTGKRLTIAFSPQEMERLDAYCEDHKLEGERLPYYSDAVRDIVAAYLERPEEKEPSIKDVLAEITKARTDIITVIETDKAIAHSRKGWFEWLRSKASALIQALRTTLTQSE